MSWIYMLVVSGSIANSLGTIFLCAPFYIPQAVHELPVSPHSCDYHWLSDCSHSCVYECCLIVVSICISQRKLWWLSIFSFVYWSLIAQPLTNFFGRPRFFGGNVYLSPCPLLGGLLSFHDLIYSSLFTSACRPFSGMWFANIFSYSMSCFFTHLMVCKHECF